MDKLKRVRLTVLYRGEKYTSSYVELDEQQIEEWHTTCILIAQGKKEYLYLNTSSLENIYFSKKILEKSIVKLEFE